MKVAIVFEIFYPTVTGIITSSVNLAQNLMAQGHEVIFIAPATPHFNEAQVDGGIPVRYIPSSYNWAYPGMRNVLPWSKAVDAVIGSEGVDVVHITGPWLLTLATMRAARRRRIPVVHTFHTMLHEPSYILYFVRYRALIPLMQWIAWWYYGIYVRRSTINTGPSHMVCGQLKSHFPRADVRFISNGVDVERFRHHASYEELVAREPRFTRSSFLFVGRLGQEKSVDEVIDAMRIVAERLPEARLFIVGDGPSADRLRRQVRTLGLEERVFFLGRVPNAELVASGLIHHALAFVTASTTENQPMTVIEAICCNTPVIVPDVEGITELVEDNGMRVQAHNPRALADAMTRMASDRAVRDRCVAAGPAMISRFDGRRVAERFLEVYRAARALQE